MHCLGDADLGLGPDIDAHARLLQAHRRDGRTEANQTFSRMLATQSGKADCELHRGRPPPPSEDVDPPEDAAGECLRVDRPHPLLRNQDPGRYTPETLTGPVVCPNPKCGVLVPRNIVLKWRERPFCSKCLRCFDTFV